MARFFALAALPCLLLTCSPAPALSQQHLKPPVPPARGCYRITTPQERLSGLPDYVRVLSCSQYNGELCLYVNAQGRPELIFGCDNIPGDLPASGSVPVRPAPSLLPW